MKYDEARSKAEIEQINRIPITEIAQSMGFHLERAGKYLSLKEHDSVIINPEANFFWRNSIEGVQGGVIHFVMHFQNMKKGDAIRELKRIGNITPESKSYWKAVAAPQNIYSSAQEKTELTLPQKDVHNRNAAAYLIKTRCIDKQIVSDLLHRHHLYQDIHKNCVFVSYDENGKANFCNQRGTNTYKKFVADRKGCDYDEGFYLDNKSSILVVTESVIDALSIATIDIQHNRDYKRNNYLALSGTNKISAVYHHLKKEPHINTLVLAFDADEAGMTALQNVHAQLKKDKWNGQIIDYLPQKANDWNEVLQLKEKDNFLLQRKAQALQHNSQEQTKTRKILYK